MGTQNWSAVVQLPFLECILMPWHKDLYDISLLEVNK